MEILYCMKWSLHKKRPIEVISQSTAFAKHCEGNRYTVVLSEKGVVNNVIELDKDGIIVRFMDEKERTYLLYGFRRKNQEEIFLNTVYYYNYENEKEIENIFYNFQENGEMFIERRDLVTGNIEERESIVNVSCNWEKYPEFGEYSRLIILERETESV